MDQDWDTLQKIIRLYCHHFNPAKCTHDLYLKCSAIVSTRCFGWGLPTTFIAPIADSFNHHSECEHKLELINLKLQNEEKEKDMSQSYSNHSNRSPLSKLHKSLIETEESKDTAYHKLLKEY